jgi:predicted outer membrane repeat protein
MRTRLAAVIAATVLLYSCDPIALRLHIAERVIGGSILYVDASAPAGGDGKSWSTAYRYLQDALEVAGLLQNQTGWAPRVHIAEGVYYPDDIDNVEPWTPQLTSFEATTHLRLYGGFPSGGGTRDPAAYVTVLSGDIDQNDIVNANGVTENPMDIIGINANTVFWILTAGDEFSPGIGEDTLVDGVTICGGGVMSGVRIEARGGETCGPTLSNLEIRGNIGSGLVIYAIEAGKCNPHVQNVLVKGNSGGVAVWSSTGGSSNPVLVNVSFVENTITGLSINAGDSAVNATIINARFEGNRSSSGGGAVFSVSEGGTNSILIVNASFVGNSATGYSSSNGGAISCSAGYMTGHTGILDVSLVNVTFSKNSAQGYGGAVYSAYCSPTFDNCILWNDSAGTSGPEIYNESGTGSVPVFTACDVQGSGGSSSWNSTLGTDGSGNIDMDPLFTTTPNPGDGDWTTWVNNNYGNLVLQGGSPAGNVGQATLLPPDVYDLDADGNTSERIPIDLAGSAREQGANVDMGAYESL